MKTPLISAAELRATSPAPLLLDCSFDLADPALGEQAYGAGHLPGAIYVHLDRDLSGHAANRAASTSATTPTSTNPRACRCANSSCAVCRGMRGHAR